MLDPIRVWDTPVVARSPDRAAPGGAHHDDLILWLAYKEAKALIGFDAPPPPDKKK